MPGVIPPAPWAFDCACCGDCCRGRQSVALNRDDLAILAARLGLGDSAGLFAQGVAEARRTEAGHWRPYLRFKTRPRRMCRFLRNELADDGRLFGYCELHPDAKPLVCHLAPLGRVADLASGGQEWRVYEPSPGCPGLGRGPLLDFDRALDARADLRPRLAAELDFFAFLEERSPGVDTPERAAAELFAWPAAAPGNP